MFESVPLTAPHFHPKSTPTPPTQVPNRAPPPHAVLQDYLRLGTSAPPQVVTHAVAAKSPAQVKALAQAFIGDRAGYANTGDFATAEGEASQ